MIVYVATKNAGKFRELQSIFGSRGWELRQHPGYVEVPEGDTSYAENAALKARALSDVLRSSGHPNAVLGDDSGLEVAALDGRPGVLSARYGGSGVSWAERRRALLAEVASSSGRRDRRARFVCALHFIGADGLVKAAEGVLEGAIAESERGESGFSYDSIFLYPPLGRTFGEMDEAAKNRISHRALAARLLLGSANARGHSPPDIPAPTGNIAPAGT